MAYMGLDKYDNLFAASCYILAFVRLVCVHWKEDIKETGKQCLAGFIAVPLTVVYLAVGWYLCNNVWETDYTLKLIRSQVT